MASYHFEDKPYISYANVPSNWRLDDGSAPPEKKYFENPSYDVATRTFTGTVSWGEVPFAGMVSWKYTMVFRGDFGAIESGTLLTTYDDGSEDTSYFG